jgi:hypothetical protein
MAPSATKQFFISFIAEELLIAQTVQEYLNEVFRGRASFFLSAIDIQPGEDWLSRIKTTIRESSGLVVILSERSYFSPWINIETGAFWINGRAIYALTHGTLPMGLVHRPLSDSQIARLDDTRQITSLLKRLARKDMGFELRRVSRMPHNSFAESGSHVIKSLVDVTPKRNC